LEKIVMATPFIGQIRMFAGNFAPRGNAFCNGQILSISQNTALFSILGTTYGGNGTTNFGLPNLLSRAPMHFGSGPGLTPRDLGETGGEETVTLLASQVPSHQHQAMGIAAVGGQNNPAGQTWGTIGTVRSPVPLYAPLPANAAMHPLAIGMTGGNQPHNNMPPFLAINFIIATQGVFPARN
jgi:microcystin-dependent protein